MAVWSHAIHRPSTRLVNFDPAYLNIVAAGVRSVFSRSGSFLVQPHFFGLFTSCAFICCWFAGAPVWPSEVIVQNRSLVEASELLINLPVSIQQPEGARRVNHYRLSYRHMRSSGWWAEQWVHVPLQLSAESGQRFRLAGLRANTEYQLRIQAVDHRGVVSLPSASVVVATRHQGEKSGHGH